MSVTPRIPAAHTFLTEQLLPAQRPLFDGIVHQGRLYPVEYTGTVGASFALPASGRPTGRGTFITIADPGDLLPDFRGTVFGQVVDPGEAMSGLQVHFGKFTDAFYSQGHVAPDGSGYFAADLSGVATSVRGQWAFQLRRTNGTLVGGQWPSGPVYSDVVAELRIVSDAETIVRTLPAPVSGEVSFPSSAPGLKRVTLTDTATGALLGASPLVTGNVRSYVIEPGQPGYGTRAVELCHTYDQALALLAALATGRDSAHLLATGLLNLQVTSGIQAGAFRLSGFQESAAFGAEVFRTGAHAFAVHALLAYMQAYPQRAESARASVLAGLAWLYARTAASGTAAGLVLGGFDAPVGGAPAVALDWASTEHNIDAYFCYRIAERVLGGPWGSRADALAGVMMTKLWNTTANRLNQGLQPTGPDTADPLDIHSWGAIFLHHIGEDAKATATMGTTQLAPFAVTTTAPNGAAVSGFATSYSAGGYPGMTPHVWWEGTYSVAYALKKIGEDSRAEQVIQAADPGQFPDGSFPYVSTADATHDLYPYRSVASTAWKVLAAVGSGVFDTGAID